MSGSDTYLNTALAFFWGWNTNKTVDEWQSFNEFAVNGDYFSVAGSSNQK